MSAVELLEEALAVAAKLGYRIRSEHLEGVRSGACVIGGRKQFFLDLTLNSVEQLDLLLEALGEEPALDAVPMSRALTRTLDRRRVAQATGERGR